MSYEGSLISNRNRELRVMLVGTRVPPNIRRALDHHGIAWKEVRETDILSFVHAKLDWELLKAFDSDVAGSEENCARARRTGVPRATIGDLPGRRPALWVPLKPDALGQAFEAFERGRSEIYYGTNGSIGAAHNLFIRNIYFKVKQRREVVAKASLVEITTVNEPQKRISPEAAREEYKFYYGFRDLIRLKPPVPLSDLRRFISARGPVRFNAQSPCIIEEIDSLADPGDRACEASPRVAFQPV